MPVSAANRINGGIFRMMRFLRMLCVVNGIFIFATIQTEVFA
jgi:hypothetical protein